MKKIKTYCDHCGKELDPSCDYVDMQLDAISDFITVDLCDECREELAKLIFDFCREKLK